METPNWPTAVVALGFIALVGLMFWTAAEGDFETIWSGVGSVVGVVTGAIPSYFFHRQARQAELRATAIAGEAPPDAVARAQERYPQVF